MPSMLISVQFVELGTTEGDTSVHCGWALKLTGKPYKGAAMLAGHRPVLKRPVLKLCTGPPHSHTFKKCMTMLTLRKHRPVIHLTSDRFTTALVTQTRLTIQLSINLVPSIVENGSLGQRNKLTRVGHVKTRLPEERSGVACDEILQMGTPALCSGSQFNRQWCRGLLQDCR